MRNEVDAGVRNGFALIDIVVALAIAGLIFAAIAALFDITTRAARRTDAAGEAQAAYALRARLADMVGNAVLMSHARSGCEGLQGDGEHLTFVTAGAPLSLGAGLADIQLAVEPGQSGSELWLKIRPYSYVPREPPDNWDDAALYKLDAAAAIRLGYRPAVKGRLAPLRTEWTESCTPPASIEVALTRESGSQDTVSLPLHIQQSANLR